MGNIKYGLDGRTVIKVSFSTIICILWQIFCIFYCHRFFINKFAELTCCFTVEIWKRRGEKECQYFDLFYFQINTDLKVHYTVWKPMVD